MGVDRWTLYLTRIVLKSIIVAAGYHLDVMNSGKEFEYGNDMQTPPDWRTVDMVDKARKKEDKGGGAICRGNKNGSDKCNDATFWENVYSDNAVCGGFTVPEFCDYRGRCIDNDQLALAPTCQPGQLCQPSLSGEVFDQVLCKLNKTC